MFVFSKMFFANQHEHEKSRQVNESEMEQAPRRIAVTIAVELPRQVHQVSI